MVTFRFKDYAHGHRQKTMQLSGEEFLRRFVQHVLPRGFVKIRHDGLIANRDRDLRLDVCRQLLLPVNALNGSAELVAIARRVDADADASRRAGSVIDGRSCLRTRVGTW